MDIDIIHIYKDEKHLILTIVLDRNLSKICIEILNDIIL